MSQFPVRQARQQDLPAMLDLYAQLHPGDPLLTADRAADIWAQMLALENVKVLIIDAEGRPISTCTLTITPSLTHGGRGYANIENVVTHADHRATGLARALITAATEMARAANCYKVFLTTGSTRESTLRFYDRSGFSRSQRTLFEIREG